MTDINQELRNYPVSKSAEKLAEDLSERGVQVQRIPPSDVERELIYSDLSDAIDAVILDIARVCPELFDNISSPVVQPGRLKAYLYAVALYHLKQVGALVSVGGVLPPTCAGAYVPNCFLAWLQYIGIYAEGDCVGRPKYQMPTSTPVVGNDSILAGTVSEANLSNSNIGLALGQFSDNNGEVTMTVSNANANTFLVNWNTDARTISGMLQKADYPCTAMWERPPAPPDGSFYAFPSMGYPTNQNTQPFFYVSPFLRWDEDIAVLYYGSANSATYNVGYCEGPRMGAMGTEWPATAGTVAWDDAFFARKCMFNFIVRGVTYEPGMPTAKLRSYHGDELSTFRCVPVLLDYAGYHEVLAKAIIQLNQQNGGSYDGTETWALLVVHECALLRKVQLSTLGYQNSANTLYRTLLPSSMDQLTVLAPMAQFINDIGPVVRRKMLHVPVAANQPNSANAWYTTWATWGATGNKTSGAFNFGIQKTAGTGDPSFQWTPGGQATQTLNAGFVTTYSALANVMYYPWFIPMKAHWLMQKAVNRGSLYGKGDLLYPPGRGPRGGLAMLIGFVPLAEIAEDVSAYTASGWKLVYRPLVGINGVTPVTGPEITMATLERFRQTDLSQLPATKYERLYDTDSMLPIVDRYVVECLSPGGTFLDALSAAMERRHGSSDAEFGLAGAGDNVDACLWDAIKGVAGTLAGVLQPVASKAAGLGCGAIPLVGGTIAPYCEKAASAVIGHVRDAASVGTNRHAATTPKEEEVQVRAHVKAIEPVQMGELPVERPAQMMKHVPLPKAKPLRGGPLVTFTPRKKVVVKAKPQQRKGGKVKAKPKPKRR